MTENIVDITIADWLKSHPSQPLMISQEISLKDLGRMMLQEHSRDAYVCEQRKVRGHLSFAKVMNHLFTQERPIHTHRQIFARVTENELHELMDPHFQYCRPNEKLADVLHRQLESGTDDLLVLDTNNQIVGVVKLHEVLKASLL